MITILWSNSLCEKKRRFSINFYIFANMVSIKEHFYISLNKSIDKELLAKIFLNTKYMDMIFHLKIWFSGSGALSGKMLLVPNDYWK